MTSTTEQASKSHLELKATKLNATSVVNSRKWRRNLDELIAHVGLSRRHPQTGVYWL